jgi:hypothetical protein
VKKTERVEMRPVIVTESIEFEPGDVLASRKLPAIWIRQTSGSWLCYDYNRDFAYVANGTDNDFLQLYETNRVRLLNKEEST